jgi:alpha/beta superfamily hydrolase
MSTAAQVAATDTFLETARYLQSGSETVFAVYTSPATAPADLGVVLAHSGANNFSAHRNGVWTDISRRLAREGVPSLRFDFAGTGESSGEFVLGIGGQPVADVTAAMDALRAAGCRRLLVVGSCFGSVPGIAAAAARGDVAGLILLSPPLVLPGAGGRAPLRDRIGELVSGPTLRTVATNRQYRQWFLARLAFLARTRVTVGLSRLARRTRPSAPRPGADSGPGRGLVLESELARLVTAGSDVDVVYGTLDDNLARVNGDQDASRAIRLLRERHPAHLAWTVLDGSVHGLEDIVVQEQLIQIVVQRARELTEHAPTAD